VIVIILVLIRQRNLSVIKKFFVFIANNVNRVRSLLGHTVYTACIQLAV